MSYGINSVCIIGRLTKDPEVRVTPTGKNVCRFRLAVKEGETTTFVQCVAWENNALFLERYVRKGATVGVDGKLRQVMYQKDGKEVNSYEVVCDRVVSPPAYEEKPHTDEQADFVEVF